MPGRFVAARLRSDWMCNGGAVLAVLPLAPGARFIESIDWPWVTRRFTGSVPANWDGADLVTAGQCIELEFVDAAGATVTHEVRIIEPVDGWPGPIVTMTAVGPEFDLQDRATIVTATENGVFTYAPAESGTATEILTRLLPFCPSYVAVGTVTPTTVVGCQYGAGSMPFDAAKVVAETVLAQSTVRYELALRRNGTTNFLLDLTVVGSAATVPDLRSGKGLISVERRTDRRAQATRAVILNGNASAFAGNRWEVSAVTVNTSIDVIDGAGGPGPAQEADLFNGRYVVDVLGGTHQITDTQVITASTTRFLMASTADLAVGDQVSIVRTTAFDDLYEVDHLAHQATYGLVTRRFAAPLPDQFSNVIRNSDLTDWSGALPAGYENTDAGTITKETSLVFAGNSARLENTVGFVGLSRTGTFSDPCWPGPVANPVLHCSVWVYITGGYPASLFVYFQANGIPHPSSGASTAKIDLVASSPQPALNAWHRVDYTAANAFPSLKVNIFVRAQNTPVGGYVYVGPFQVLTGTTATVSPAAVDTISNAVDVYRKGSNPSKAMQYAYQALNLLGPPPTTYRLNAGELTRVDPVRWPHDLWTLGATINVREPERLGLSVSPRIVALDRNLFDPFDAQIEAAIRVPDFVNLLVGGA